MLGSAAVAFVQNGSFELALMAGGLSLAITSAEGYLITPIRLGQATRVGDLVTDFVQDLDGDPASLERGTGKLHQLPLEQVP